MMEKFLNGARAAEMWEKVKTSLSAKQDKLTGQPGQVVGFGSDGSAAAVRGWSNPNLLDNWYFADPINQRGQTEYTSIGYTIDRWKLDLSGASNGSISLNTNGLFIKQGSTISKVMSIYQPIENPGRYAGKDVTFSILVKGTHYSQILLNANNGTYFSRGSKVTPDKWTLVSLTCTLPDALAAFNANIYSDTNAVLEGDYTQICTAKLELGPVQTLAHQDADGNWVLNDPPPNKALELAKCQRYFLSQPYCNYPFTYIGQKDIEITVPTPATMRINPALTGFEIRNENGVPQTGFAFSAYASPNCVKIIANKTNHGITGGYFAGTISANLTAEL